MTSFQSSLSVWRHFNPPYLYDVISILLICMTSCHIKKHLLEIYVYKKVYMIWLFQYHTVSTLNQYNPSSRALGIKLVSRVRYWKSHMIFSIYWTTKWNCIKFYKIFNKPFLAPACTQNTLRIPVPAPISATIFPRIIS